MPKAISSFELTLDNRPQHQTPDELALRAIAFGHYSKAGFGPETRLPASREFARQYGVIARHGGERV